MAEDMVNTTPEIGDDDEAFDVLLPVTDAVDGAGATHVAHMRGNQAAFVDVLAEFVRTGSDLSAPLRGPIDDSSLDAVRFSLGGLGPARVESIEPL
jgi:hypothetical protein